MGESVIMGESLTRVSVSLMMGISVMMGVRSGGMAGGRGQVGGRTRAGGLADAGSMVILLEILVKVLHHFFSQFRVSHVVCGLTISPNCAAHPLRCHTTPRHAGRNGRQRQQLSSRQRPNQLAITCRQHINSHSYFESNSTGWFNRQECRYELLHGPSCYYSLNDCFAFVRRATFHWLHPPLSSQIYCIVGKLVLPPIPLAPLCGTYYALLLRGLRVVRPACAPRISSMRVHCPTRPLSFSSKFCFISIYIYIYIYMAVYFVSQKENQVESVAGIQGPMNKITI